MTTIALGAKPVMPATSKEPSPSLFLCILTVSQPDTIHQGNERLHGAFGVGSGGQER
jgi:hypothetical protein